MPSSTAVGAATQQIVCLNGSNIHCPYHGVLGTDANDNPYCYPDGTDPAATAPNVDLSASELGVCDDGSTPGALGYDNTGTLLALMTRTHPLITAQAMVLVLQTLFAMTLLSPLMVLAMMGPCQSQL